MPNIRWKLIFHRLHTSGAKRLLLEGECESLASFMTKATTILILSFLAGAMLAHARYQPIFNELGRIDAEIEAYRNGAVVGWVRMDRVSKQLYFEERP